MKGQEKLREALAGVKRDAEATGTAADTAGVDMEQAAKDAQRGFETLKTNIAHVSLELEAAKRAAAGFGGETVGQMGKALDQVTALQKQLDFLKAAQRQRDPATRNDEEKSRRHEKLTKNTKKLSEALKTLRTTATAAFAGLTGSVMGFVTAGFAGTTHAAALEAQMARLGRGIASIFVPEMNKLIETVRAGADWLLNLDGETQKNIAHWIEAAIVFAGAVFILPKLFSGIMAVASAVKVLTVALVTMNLTTGGIITAIGTLATVLVGIGAASYVAKHGITDLFSSLVMTKEQAEDLEKELADLKAYRDALNKEAASRGPQFGLFNPGRVLLDVRASEAKEKIDALEAQLAGFRKRKEPRTDVTLARTGTESITATIQRLQSAALKQDYSMQTAKNTGDLVSLVKEITAFVKTQTGGVVEGVVGAMRAMAGQGA